MDHRPENEVIIGYKGGEAKPHTPVEAPDSRASIDYIKMLLGLGEGEWEGGITGQDIYINDTPILAKDGSTNIPNVTWDFRPGTIDQTYIQGIPSVDNEVAQNVEVTNENFFTYSATNPELSALRVRIQFDALYQYQENGDMVGAPLKYTVELQTGAGAWTTVVNGELNDKFTTKYSRTHRIDLPDNASGNWTIRVRKLTADVVSNTKAANTMRVAAVAEVIDAKMVYPNTALLFVQFDASLYASTPKISVDAKGRKVRVPNNMDPVARTFTGVWDGTFKTAWTTDPVWHWYDIVLNRRFGLGRRIDATMVNKWALYRLSQYAGQQVSDGKGGTQPRFSCNVYIQRRQDAYRVLMDMASIFRGMSFWDGSSMTLNADMPDDVVYTFSPSNIIGQFETVSSARKERYNLTVVKWDNPANGYATQSRPVHNTKSQVRYGVWQTEITAIGCTDEAEAVRRGEWTNLTALYETHTVSFTCGVEGRNVPPGSIIAIADPDLAGKPMGGRIRGVQGRSLTLDRNPEVVAGDTLRVVLPSGVAQERSIANVADRVVTVVASFTETPMVDSQWSVEREELVTVKYRVLNNDETDDGKGNRKIVAVEHNPSKYNAVDSGAKVEVPPVTAVPVASLTAPKNIIVTQNVFTDQGIAVTTMSVVWDQVASAVRYEVQWRRDNGTWVNAGVVTANGIDIDSVYAGSYVVRVRAISSMDVYSVWGMSDATGLQGKTEPPPTLAFIKASDDKVFSIEVTWGFRDGTSDTAYTELQTSLSANMDEATSLGQYAYPTDKLSVNGAASGVDVYFRGRLIDKSGNVGAWSETVRGKATADPTKVNEVVGEEFAQTILGQQFFDEIELITADASVPGSVNYRLKTVLDEVDASVAQVEQGLTDANQAIGSIQDQIDNIGDLADSQEYKGDRTYSAGKIVTLNNSFYQAKVDVPAGKTPPDTAYWRDAGAIIQQGDGLAARVTSAENTITQQGTAITANSTDITQLKTSIKDKADASALNTLTTRVSSVEGVNTSQATAITNLQTSVTDINKNKADASALTALTNRVTTAEGSITSQGNSITQLQGSVKSNTDGLAATNQTVTNLSSTVTQQGTTLTSQGQALTSINAALGDAGGENLLFNPSFDVWASDTQPTADGWEGGTDGVAVWSKQPSTLDPNGFVQRLVLTGLSDTKGAYVTNTFASNKIVAPNQQVTLSVYMKATAGAQLFMAMRNLDASQANLAYVEGNRVTATGDWQRITFTATTVAGTVHTRFIPRVLGTASLANVTWDIDRAQLELGARATGWHDNGKTNIAAISAQATATSQLSGRVTNVEGTLTSQATSITSLRADLSNAGGENLLYNPAFTEVSPDARLALGWNMDGGTVDATTSATASLVTSWMSSAEKAMRIDFKGVDMSARYFSINTAVAYRVKIGAVGQPVTASIYMRGTPGARMQIFIQALKADGVAIGAPVSQLFTLDATGQRFAFTHTGLPAETALVSLFYRMRASATGVGDGYVEGTRAQLELGASATGWSNNGKVLGAQQDATATALSTLTATVTSQGGSITSQAGLITSLQTSVKGAVQQAFNMVPNPTFDPAFNTMGFYIVQTSAAGVPANCPFPYAARLTARDNFPDINSLPNFPVKTGDVYRFSALVAAGANTGTRPFQHYATRATSPFGGRTAYQASPMTSVTQTWTRVTWDHTIPAGQTFLNPMLQIETLNAETATWYVTDWHCENITAAKNAQTTADAAATATTNLGTRVTTAEGTLTAQSNQITALQAQISGVGSFAAAQNFEFLNTNRGFYLEQAASGATLTAYQQNLTLSGYANLRSPVFPDLNGAVNPIIRMRVRLKNATRNPLRIYWANEDGGLAEARTATIPVNLSNTGWQDLELDLSGNAAWATKAKNNSIRFDLLNAADTTAVVDIAYIAIGRRGASASATALSDTQATVTQQGNSITSLVSKTDTLQTTVNGQTSSIQQITQIQTDTNNRIAASWQLKFGQTAQGLRYAAGIGFNVESGGGNVGLQSTFAVAADRFLVLGPGIDGNGRTFFSVVNGNTYINTAFIDTAFIRQGIIGQSIESANKTWAGVPIMNLDFNAGAIYIRSEETNLSEIQIDRAAFRCYVNNRLRVRVGRW